MGRPVRYLEEVQKVIGEFERLEPVTPARLCVHSASDWTDIMSDAVYRGFLREGLRRALVPTDTTPRSVDTGLCGSFMGIPVVAAPLIAKPGELVLLKGRVRADYYSRTPEPIKLPEGFPAGDGLLWWAYR